MNNLCILGTLEGTQNMVIEGNFASDLQITTCVTPFLFSSCETSRLTSLEPKFI